MRVNGNEVALDIAPGAMLADVLRDQLHLTGIKIGCREGGCGTCTVLLDGEPVVSCILPAWKAGGCSVLTIEGLAGPDGGLHPIQTAFLAEGAVQCGFCTPGMVLAAKALLDANPDPTDDDIRHAFTGHLCRCTGYAAVIAAVRRAARAMRTGEEIALDMGTGAGVVGRSVVRKDGPDKVRGAQVYGADLGVRGWPRLDGALHAAAVFSEHPYAEVLRVDTARAAAMPGVACVLTAADVPGLNAQGIIIPHQPIFVGEGQRVRCVSDILALVVAESEQQAREATAAVEVEYRLLEGVFSPEAALAPGAPILHAPRPGDQPSNVMYGTHVEKGDVDAALAAAPVVVEDTFRTPFVEHAYLEPEAGAAAAVGAEGVVTVWMASQAVTFHQRMVAQVLALPPEKVRLVHVQPGGAFGARNDMSLHPYLALAALRTGRPVKMALSRAESLRYHSKRHAMEHRLRLGADRDGRLLALDCHIMADTGAYSSAGIPVLDQATLFATGPYEIANVRIAGLAVYTNNIACGAMRGFGIPQSAFAIESLLDELASRLDIDPFELRRRNGLLPGSLTATGQVLGVSAPFLETLRLAREAAARSLAELPPPAPGWRRGLGVGCCYKNVGLGLGLPEPAGATIELTPGGRIAVGVGGADLGQGSDTVLAQLAAQALGVPYGLVDVVAADTALTPDGGITSASRTTFMSGNAVVEAAAIFGERLRSALRLGSDSTGPLTAGDLASLAGSLAGRGERLRVEHTYQPPRTSGLDGGGDGAPLNFVTFSYATQAAIVDVDPETGSVEVRKIVAVHDIGRAINPAGARGQVAGSCLMGLGYALSEEFILNRGRLVTGTLESLHIPTMADAPEIEVILVEDPDPQGPLGAKGMAEAAVIPTAPAITNAIYNAVGVRVRHLPARAERVRAEVV
jgi:selenium-dependent xanthine dehydrogenase